MALYKEILIKILEKEDIQIVFPNLEMNIKDIVELECYKILRSIKTIIEDNSIDDKECFYKIEQIIDLFEKFHIFKGSRHDF